MRGIIVGLSRAKAILGGAILAGPALAAGDCELGGHMLTGGFEFWDAAVGDAAAIKFDGQLAGGNGGVEVVEVCLREGHGFWNGWCLSRSALKHVQRAVQIP